LNVVFRQGKHGLGIGVPSNLEVLDFVEVSLAHVLAVVVVVVAVVVVVVT
jgi:hypothetical protein